MQIIDIYNLKIFKKMYILYTGKFWNPWEEYLKFEIIW